MTPEDRSNGPFRPGEKSSGIIDTIGRAFAMLNRRPYLVWMPIALDLLLWSGLRVSVADPLADVATGAERWIPGFSGTASTVRESVSVIDLAGVATWPVPTLVTDLGRRSVPNFLHQQEVTVPAGFGLAALVLSVVVALLIGVTYLTVIGRLVSNRPAWGIAFLADCATNTAKVGVVLAAMVVFLTFLLTPFILVGWGLRWAGLEPTGFLLIIAAMYAIWVMLYFAFSPHAVALSSVNPFAAMRASYQVVQQNVLSVIGLLLIVVLIRAGMPLALQIFTESRWSTPFAIVANAYVATGLFAATMLYYRDRSAGVLDHRRASSPAS